MTIPDRNIKTLDELAELDIQILLDSNAINPNFRDETGKQRSYLDIIFTPSIGEIDTEELKIRVDYLNQLYSFLREHPNISTTRMVTEECARLSELIRERYKWIKGKKRKRNQRVDLVGKLSDNIITIRKLMKKRSGRLKVSNTEELTHYSRGIHNQEADIDLVSHALLSDKHSAIISNDRHIEKIMLELRTRFYNSAQKHSIPQSLKERLTPISSCAYSLHPTISENGKYDLNICFRGGF